MWSGRRDAISLTCMVKRPRSERGLSWSLTPVEPLGPGVDQRGAEVHLCRSSVLSVNLPDTCAPALDRHFHSRSQSRHISRHLSADSSSQVVRHPSDADADTSAHSTQCPSGLTVSGPGTFFSAEIACLAWASTSSVDVEVRMEGLLSFQSTMWMTSGPG